MRRPQFSRGTLLIVMLMAACFISGIRFERERRRREDEAAALAAAANSPAPSATLAPIAPAPMKWPANWPTSLGVVEKKQTGGSPPNPAALGRQGSPYAEALELRGFEGLTPRPVR